MGHGNKVEFLVAICALISSIIAIFVAWDQGRVMRAQQHGMVYPVLQVDGYVRLGSERTALGIDVRNSGVGPALIESVTIRIPGSDQGDFSSFLDTLPDGYELSWEAVTGRALAPGETATPVEILWAVENFPPEMASLVTRDTSSWELNICYCSVFGRCWQTRRIGRSRAERVKQCQPGEIDIFESLGEQYMLQRNSPPIVEEVDQ